MIYLYALLGLLGHLVIKWQKNRKKEGFNLKEWAIDRLPDFILTIIAIVALANSQDALYAYFKVPENVVIFLKETALYGIMLGYMGNSIIRNIFKVLFPSFQLKSN